MKASPGRARLSEGRRRPAPGNHWAEAALLADWRSEAVRAVEEAVAKVQREPAPDPYRRGLVRAVLEASGRGARARGARGRGNQNPGFGKTQVSITYLEAIREAQARALRDDPRVFIYGQDVGAFGGAFKATKNLAKEFPGRVLDSPISEDAMVGLAVGAAIEGHAADHRNAVRGFFHRGLQPDRQSGGDAFLAHQRALSDHRAAALSAARPGAGRSTASAWNAIYAHYPGLVVLTPATVEDAYSMLLEAVAIDDPVIFCEHKFLYYHLKAEKLPSEALPVGKARIAREGRDMTIVAYSAMVQEALAAAEELAPKAGKSKSWICAPSNRSTPTRSWPRWRGRAGCCVWAKRGRGAA